jgi:hypothetical protein
MGTMGSFPGDKRPGHQTDHSPPSCAEIKNDANIPPLLHILYYAEKGKIMNIKENFYIYLYKEI